MLLESLRKQCSHPAQGRTGAEIGELSMSEIPERVKE